jgi:hypothetical protein
MDGLLTIGAFSKACRLSPDPSEMKKRRAPGRA